MKKFNLAFLVLLIYPQIAGASSGKFIGSLGFEMIDHKWSGGVESKFNSFTLIALYSIPVFSLSSQTSFFIAPGLRISRLSGDLSDKLETGESYTQTIVATPYMVACQAGLQYSSSSLGFDIFGMYHHGLGGTFEFSQTFQETNYTSKIEYEYKSHTEIGGGLRLLFPYSASMQFGLEAVYFVADSYIKDVQQGSVQEDKPTETGKGIRLLLTKRF